MLTCCPDVPSHMKGPSSKLQESCLMTTHSYHHQALPQLSEAASSKTRPLSEYSCTQRLIKG